MSLLGLMRVARESRLLRWTLYVLSAGLLALLGAEWLHPKDSRDMSLYWEAGRAVLSHRLPYQDYSRFGPALTPGNYFYSPTFAALMAPLAQLPYLWFARLWYIVVLSALGGYAFSLVKLAGGRVSGASVLLMTLLLMVSPTDAFGTVREGQAEILVWALFGLALTNPRAQAPALAAALFVKPHAIWALAAACVTGRGQATLAAACTLAVGIMVGWLAAGPTAHVAWLHTIAPLSQGSFCVLNVSPSMAVLRALRLLGIWHYGGGPLPLGPRVFLATVAILGPALVWWRVRRRSPEFQVAALGLAAVLSSPLAWYYYLGIAFAPLAVWWGERGSRTVCVPR
jgi:hypothetical protein